MDGQTLERLSSNKEEGLDEDLLTELVQWSDLIVFDYLTGNYDRVASMQVSNDILLGQRVIDISNINDPSLNISDILTDVIDDYQLNLALDRSIHDT